mgnify:CR=1 FL=1
MTKESDLYCGALFHSKKYSLNSGTKMPKYKPPKLTVDVATILSQRMPVFAHKKDCNEALKYAQSILGQGTTPAEVIMTAIMVYHNTLLNTLANGALEKETAQNDLPINIREKYNNYGDNSEEHF